MMALIRPFTDTEGGGELVTIDTPQYLENTQPTAPNVGTLTGPAQADLTINDVVTTSGVPSPGGRYGSAYPIQDGTGRLLVSWSQCRLIEVTEDFGDPLVEPPIVPCTDERLASVVVIDPDNPATPAIGEFIQAPPLYGIWMYDQRDNTQLPVVPGVEGFMFSEVVAADPRLFAVSTTSTAGPSRTSLHSQTLYRPQLPHVRRVSCASSRPYHNRMTTCWISTIRHSASARSTACGKSSATP
jgi:hypothetical protein